MDPMIRSFVDGMGAAAASSGILTQQQARIFAFLYLQDGPLSLDEIATALEQSKSNISINVRGLVSWHLIRRRSVAGSRKDHYQAATDFFRAMQEIFESRFRWTVRQVLAVVEETRSLAQESPVRPAALEQRSLAEGRLAALEQFFSMVNVGIGMFVQGEPFPTPALRNLAPLDAPEQEQSAPPSRGEAKNPRHRTR